MKKYIFFAACLCIFTQLLHAQKKEINSNADLPVISYETAVLKTSDTAAIHTWIKNLAASESKHTDSILQNYKINNLGIWITLTRTKALCDFITANWNNLKYADTVFRNVQEAWAAFKKCGIAELSSYAKAALLPETDINKMYLKVLIQAMDPLTQGEKEMFTGYLLSNMNNAPVMYKTELQKFENASFVPDTSIYNFLKGYVYIQLKEKFYKPIFAYINNAIKEKFTRADTLRGTVGPERAWWDLLHYSITVKPDYTSKTITGSNTIQYKVISSSYPTFMQIDLQEPLTIDSVIFNASRKLPFTKDGNAWHVQVPKQKQSSVDSVTVYYHGLVHESVQPPWFGGWVWAKDSLGNPWMSTACQGIGASIWYPCKDHQSDEPDNGVSIAIIVPDTLDAIANGRLQSKQKHNDGTTTYTWEVVNPINNYGIALYTGKYVNISETYNGEKGKLDVNYWVLNYNEERARAHLLPQVNQMLKAFEYWMGPYPFYEDGYKLVESPYNGMEHQSAIAYGNHYLNGYEGYDFSGKGWGLKWDYMIVHESGHEWFGNSITTKDIAEMWVQEGITNLSEGLFTEYWYGKQAAKEYLSALRNNIGNIFPVIGYYGVNDNLSATRGGDMYPKGALLIYSIRNSIDNDTLFRQIIRGLQQTFYHQTVTSSQIENYISKQAGYNYSKVFDQYLRNIEIPKLEFYFNNDSSKVFYRYTNCINGFDLPLALQDGEKRLKIFPSAEWKDTGIAASDVDLFNAAAIEEEYYIMAVQVK